MNDWLTVTNWVPPVNDAVGQSPVTEDGVTGGHRREVTPLPRLTGLAAAGIRSGYHDFTLNPGNRSPDENP